MPAVLVVLVGALAGIGVASLQVRAQDAAGDAARILGRGEAGGRRDGERGAGAVLAVAVVAAVALVAVAVVGLGVGLAARQRVLRAADAAALAAADAASGAVAGEPCPLAAKVAAADGARLDD